MSRRNPLALGTMLIALSAAQVTAGAAAASPTVTVCRPGTAVTLLATADRVIARHDPRGALKALDAGLQTLGGSYARPATIDDTGMHLTLATIEQRKGRLATAAILKRRILAQRLQLCGPGS